MGEENGVLRLMVNGEDGREVEGGGEGSESGHPQWNVMKVCIYRFSKIFSSTLFCYELVTDSVRLLVVKFC